MKSTTSALKVFIAILLAVVLFASVMVTTAVAFAGEVVDHETVQQIILDVDRSDLFQYGSGVREALDEYGLDEQFVEDALASETMGQFLEAYMEDLRRVMDDPDAAPRLDAKMLKEICTDNLDEIVDMVEAMSLRQGVEAPNKSRIRVLMDEFLYYYSDDILEKLPDPAEFVADNSRTSTTVVRTAIRISTSATVFVILVAVCVVLAVLMFLCRRRNWKGFKWIAVVALICAFTCEAIRFVAGLVGDKIRGSGISEEIFRYMVELLQSHYLMCAIWLAAVSVLFMGLYVFLQKRGKKNGSDS